MNDAIRLERSDQIAEIILNKPEKRNALSMDMWAALPDLIARANSDEDIKVIIVHGGNAGAFAAGADISEFEETYASIESSTQTAKVIAQGLDAVEQSTKPTLSAIDGACVGGGVSLAMATDIRFASNRSKFGVTPAKLGLVYPPGDTRRLLNAMGPGATKDILFSGRILTADEALRIRMIDRIVEEGSVLEATKEYCQMICSNSQWSARATKKMIQGIQSGEFNASASAGEELFLKAFSGEDFQEGYKAFLAKRPAKFTFK